MSEQIGLSELEYAQRKRKTKRDKILEKADALFPWADWAVRVAPFYPKRGKGRQPKDIETMLRMTLLKRWFGLSDAAVEDAIYDSYAMKRFMRIDFMRAQPPDATTLRRFQALLKKSGLLEAFEAEMSRILHEKRLTLRRGTATDAALIRRTKKHT